MRSNKFFLLIFILVSGCKEYIVFEKENEYVRVNFIAGCSESGTLSKKVCECQFDTLIRTYDKEFYKDKSLMNDEIKYKKFEEVAFKAIQYCERLNE